MTVFEGERIEIPEEAKALIMRGDLPFFLNEYGAGDLGVKTLRKDWRHAVAKTTEKEILFREMTNPEDPTIPLLINGLVALNIEG